jgi:hypothetical protein
VSKKKPAKKRAATTAKPRARKATAVRRRRPAAKRGRPLVDAPPDKVFWVNFGPVLKNLQELRDALRSMSESQFAHHVGPGRNDFANWVEGVLDDAECAGVLRRARSRSGAVRAVKIHLKAYV